ncbi:TetR/AcrR family transcriptional regulator [Bacillus sp. JJ634]
MVKKQLIMDKALELFSEQGFEATSVQQITEHCGISKGAFYLSFKSKDELILALIDYFMMQITADIDQSVRNCSNKEELLYVFYFTTFRSFSKHSAFAKMFLKEQTQTFNEELISKHDYYDSHINESILYILDQLYGEQIEETKYDLLICIKGFIQIYSGLYLRFNLPLDIDSLTKSLVEKTALLAQHSTIPFISGDIIRIIKEPIHEQVTTEHIAALIEQKIGDIENPIEQESLQILKDNLFKTNTSLAITKGLLENIKNNPHCKWISYLIREYYQL